MRQGKILYTLREAQPVLPGVQVDRVGECYDLKHVTGYGVWCLGSPSNYFEPSTFLNENVVFNITFICRHIDTPRYAGARNRVPENTPYCLRLPRAETDRVQQWEAEMARSNIPEIAVVAEGPLAWDAGRTETHLGKAFRSNIIRDGPNGNNGAWKRHFAPSPYPTWRIWRGFCLARRLNLPAISIPIIVTSPRVR